MRLPSGEKSGSRSSAASLVSRGLASCRSLQPEIELPFAVAVRRVHHHRPVARQRRLGGKRGIRRHAGESWTRRRALELLSRAPLIASTVPSAAAPATARLRQAAATSGPGRAAVTFRREAPRRPRRHPARVGRPRYRGAAGSDPCRGIAAAAAACSSVWLRQCRPIGLALENRRDRVRRQWRARTPRGR